MASQLVNQGEDVVIVVPGERELAEMRVLLGVFSSGQQQSPWVVFPSFKPGSHTALEWGSRWTALHGLYQGTPGGSSGRGILLSVESLLPKWPAPDVAALARIELSQGEEISSELVLEQLVEWGYRRVPMVTGPGEMAMRGDILDVYSPAYDKPLRLEFFGNDLEALRLFNPTSQRSVDVLEQAFLFPVAPALMGEPFISQANNKWNTLKTTGQINSNTREHLRSAMQQGEGQFWPGLYYAEPARLHDYFSSKAIFLLSGADDLRAKLKEAAWAWEEHLEKNKKDGGPIIPLDVVLWPEEDARKTWIDRRQLVFEGLVMGERKEGIELEEHPIREFQDLFWKPDQLRRPWQTMVGAFKQWTQEGQTCVVGFHSGRARQKFIELAVQDELPLDTRFGEDLKGIAAVVAPLRNGMELSWAGLRIFPEGVLQPKSERTAQRKDTAFEGLKRYDDLEDNDLLVHRDYGVCMFSGLKRISVGEVANDYLLLRFAGDDNLYLPVDRMGLVQKYKGPEGQHPALDNLRGTRWKNATQRAKKAIEKIAHELVEMYAYRQVAKGYAYQAPGELFWEFEASFGFEETPDQAKAIREVLEDMERSEPMDRLVCGDVGFGKTEVAMRAAFRAVLDGKQVVILCPTTVLAEQHYQNFKSRMRDYPVNVGMLSRFVAKAEQRNTLEAARKGRIDILVGTHRLLSKDVFLPNLGLLVLDEEQRFGVKHKEKLKELKRSVDALTLTATPIPRTLQLSLSGIRSLSVIETPPHERKPVETALLERDDTPLKNILERELERGGQVFWVHNRVRTLEGVAAYVSKLAPDARIGMAHGQMTATRLEETMHSFWHGDLDILVCTSIVESGLDFPNANTLIVDQAQMFGLGQLYQLRGRVGRSERQAYAYFVVPKLDAIPEDAKKRLRVILDMDFLGAGFQIALEDLRLRGAGNILGEAQSGQIAKVGLDLFMEMLAEEVARLKGEDLSTIRDPEINFVFPAHIPEDYIAEPNERLKYYRSLSAAKTADGVQEIAEELRDRFGPLQPALNNFVSMLELKRVLAALAARQADLFPGRAVCKWDSSGRGLNPDIVLPWLQKRDTWAKLLPDNGLELRLPHNTSTDKSDIAESMAFFARELAQLLDQGHAQS